MGWLFKYKRALGITALSLFNLWRAAQRSPNPMENASVYMQLIRADWQVEKNRLLNMFAFSLLGACFTLATLIIIGIVALALSWNTAYFSLMCALFIGGYIFGAVMCIVLVIRLAKQGETAFAASRQEIALALTALREGT